MIELNALFFTDPRSFISPDEFEGWKDSCTTGQLSHVAGHHAGNHLMLVCGDVPVGDCHHSGPKTSLICQVDLWNVEELRRQVGLGAEQGSAALLASLFEAHGDSFVLKLQGSFVVILYDHRSQVLRAYTDPFSTRSLCYNHTEGKLAIASDLRRLIKALKVQPAIDPTAILEYLQYTCIPAPRTIYQSFKRLEPGHQLACDPSPRSQCYWDMHFDESPSNRRSETEWAALTEAAIRKAVARSIVLPGPDKRLGCFLSGGTDSSSVTGLVGRLTSFPARSFSIGFDDPRYNEIGYARVAAKYFRTDHNEYFVTPEDIVSLVPNACSVYDEPFGNSSIIPSYFCARLAQENGVTHLLAGDGGDELFGGNERYVSDLVFQRYQLLPIWVRKWMLEPLVGAAAARLGRLRFFDLAGRYVRRANVPVPDRFFSYGLISSVAREQLFQSNFLIRSNGMDPLERARLHYNRVPTGSVLNRWLYLDLKMTIGDNDLRKVTRMGDLAGVVVRYPLLDRGLAEFTGTIPSSLKVKGNHLRYLFKKAMTQVLPKEIVKKQKHGFGLPYSVWLGENRHLKEFTFDILGSSRCRNRGYFRKDLLDWLWGQYQSEDRGYYGDVIWVFLMLEYWHLQEQGGNEAD